MNKQTEYQLHKTCFEWIKLHPKLLPYFYTIDHGELRNIKIATKLKAKGVKGGIPDCLLLKPNKEYSCLWIELKIETKKLTK